MVSDFNFFFSNAVRKAQQDKNNMINENKTIGLESKKAYYNLVNPKYITWDFYSKYINVEPNFGQLGLIVYLRTYSRFVPELNRREKWCETILRVVEYSLSLEDNHNENLRSFEQKKKEAEDLFDCLFTQKGYVAGRTYWIGGTKAVEFDSSANFNCSGSKIDSISSFAEGFVWLLLGAGFGYSIENKHIKLLPDLPNLEKKITHVNDFSYDGFEHTRYNSIQLTKDDLSLTDQEFEDKVITYSNYITIKIGDSKHGWATAFRSLLHALYSPTIKNIVLDYSSIRKEGERLKTFGGRSSGYKPLQEHFERVVKIFQDCPTNKLRSIDCLDILNSMGLAVVVSGIRRSSEICLFDQDDDLLLHAKDNLWLDENLADKRETRVMSNNSIALYDNPGFDYFNKVMQSVKTSSEPGLFVLGNANKRAGRLSVCNPCAV